MNTWLLCSGLLALATAAVHIVAGQRDPVRPFLNSNLEDVPKATLLACWHMVSVMLLCGACTLIFIGWKGDAQYYTLTYLIGVIYVLFTVVFIVVGTYFFKFTALVKLPQWVLLLPIGLLALLGS
ncbi:hypothetical protein N474_23535 [Pseudoalteromonas luteoviolacea CPMOR-2]|uniref:hypothetical protein n=1 Tax=Pseudoalteromonas luteoviolacea TaxID=43657 RepID=UPI0007B058EE|nr:hypothetical protein [Pseudoalteromonas luteoviolacea]KZN52191.1 hypothetical protein N474_23535 [Pseudoalteromonas luteoviolacea CPMOR-2]